MNDQKKNQASDYLETLQPLPDQIDSVLTIIPNHARIAIGTILFLSSLFIAWTFLGSIPVTLEGRGLLISPMGLFSIQTKVKGTLNNLKSNVGDIVQEGEVIANIEDPLEQIKLAAVRLKVARLTKNLKELEKNTLQGSNKVQESLTKEIEEKKEQLEEQMEIKDLLEANQVNYNIVSPYKAKILGLFFHNGDLIEPGNVVVWLERLDSRPKEQQPLSFEILSFFSLKDGKKISVGNSVEIDLSSVNVQEYGSILGTVKSVSPYATSRENIMDIIRNKELVDYLLQDSTAMLEVTIVPELDPSTPSGVRWESGKGPNQQISTGTLATLSVTINRIRPIYFVAPLWEGKNIGN